MNLRPDDELRLKRVLAEMADLPPFLGLELSDPRQVGHTGSTPLHVAAIRGDVPAGRILISCGARVNAVGECGYTPLHDAAAQGHSDFVKLLLLNGADRASRNMDGKTAEALADLLGHREVAQLLKPRL